MPDIIYYSNITETTHRFVNRLTVGDADVTRIPLKGDYQDEITRNYILIIPTYGGTSALERRRHVVPAIIRFLNNEANRKHCIGVIACGNRNFGKEYGRAGDIIADKLGVPLLHKLELAGDSEDLTIVNNILTNLDHTANHVIERELTHV